MKGFTMKYKTIQTIHELRMITVQIVVPLACAGMVYLSNEDNKRQAQQWWENTKYRIKNVFSKK